MSQIYAIIIMVENEYNEGLITEKEAVGKIALAIADLWGNM